MANRLVSNMYIIDSHQLGSPLRYGNSDGTVNTSPGKMLVWGVVFLPLTTAGYLSIALGNTANVVLDYKYIDGGAGMFQRTQVDHFGYGVPWKDVYIPTLSAATAVLILG